MMNPWLAVSGKELKDRSLGSYFIGHPTHSSRKLLVEMMKQSNLPFFTSTDEMPQGGFMSILRNAKICLAPWGANPLTYRFFEGLSSRCLVMAPSIRGISFLDGGLMPGRDYVELSIGLEDLTEKVSYYIRRIDEAQNIANRGFEHYKKYFEPKVGWEFSSWMWENVTRSWPGYLNV